MTVEDIQTGVEAATQELARCGLSFEAESLRGCETLSPRSIMATRELLRGMRVRPLSAQRAIAMATSAMDRYLARPARHLAHA